MIKSVFQKTGLSRPLPLTPRPWMLAVALFGVNSSWADTIVLRGREGSRETIQSGVTIVEDGAETVKYTKGVALSQVEAAQVVRIVYEGLPPEFAEAESAAASGDAAKAASLYAKASEKTQRVPAKLHVLYRGGESLLDAGRFAEAKVLFEQCAAAGGEARLAGLARIRTAQCDFYGGELDRARDALRSGSGRATGEREALRRYWMGRVLAARGEWESARDQIEDAARAARDVSPAVFQLSQVRGAWLAGRTEPQKGIEALEKARAGLTDPAAQAEYHLLVADLEWRAAGAAADATARQDAQVRSAVSALRVVAAYPNQPEAAARAYAIAHQALAALKDKKADEIKAEGDRRFSGTGWAKLK